jgi:hypothetical protein
MANEQEKPDARHQLLITLVHGTWGRGFFPKRQRQNRRPFWFEEGGPFLASLSGELGDIPHKIWPLLWSGENSIVVRDHTAQALADHLSAEHAEHPQATQLVIAHSHGGNIALRALHYLRQLDTSLLCGAESSQPFVVTLATPFIEVHKADFGRRPEFVRLAVLGAIALPFSILALFSLKNADHAFVLPLLAAFFILFGGLYWTSHRAAARQNKVEALSDATRLGEIAPSQRLLIIRAIDDEASLVLAFGTIANYLTTRMITYVWFIIVWVIIVIGSILIPALLSLLLVGWEEAKWSGSAIDWVASLVRDWAWYRDLILLICSGLMFFLIGWLMAWRSVHGRELALSPMECQINTQSTPDAVSLSKIVTLVRRTYVKSLRHGIYDHEDCAKAIADWARLQLHVRL